MHVLRQQDHRRARKPTAAWATPGDLTLRDTSHYLAPLIGWQLPKDMRLSFSPGLGLTRASLDHVYRIGFAVSFGQIGSWFHDQSTNMGGIR